MAQKHKAKKRQKAKEWPTKKMRQEQVHIPDTPENVARALFPQSGKPIQKGTAP